MLDSNPSTQRILIFGESIFEVGITQLLKSGFGLQVASTRYTNELAFLTEITQNQPDVILLNESIILQMNLAYTFKLLFSRPALAGLRIIVTNLSNNVIDVYMLPKQVFVQNGYERQQYSLTKPAELVAVVRG